MKQNRKDNALHFRLTQAERKTLEVLAVQNEAKLSAIVRELIREALTVRASPEKGVTR